MVNKKFLIENFWWGFVLWLFGYILGIILIFFVPSNIIGWVITPFGVAFTWFILSKKIHLEKISEFVTLGIIWAILAIVLDYVFIVKMFNPPDGYYKLDVYFYYLFTLTIPVIYGYINKK